MPTDSYNNTSSFEQISPADFACLAANVQQSTNFAVHFHVAVIVVIIVTSC